MWDVYLLFDGMMERSIWGDVLRAYSSVTLVTNGPRKIIVDTGFKGDTGLITGPLEHLGLHREHIDTVILTHAHRDHIGNLDLFPNSLVFIHALEMIEHAERLAELVPRDRLKLVEEEEQVLESGLTMHLTPGHTNGSMSLLVKDFMFHPGESPGDEPWNGRGKVLVAAGDAVPNHGNLKRHIVPLWRVDSTSALESILWIESIADVVLTGHQGYLFVDR